MKPNPHNQSLVMNDSDIASLWQNKELHDTIIQLCQLTGIAATATNNKAEIIFQSNWPQWCQQLNDYKPFTCDNCIAATKQEDTQSCRVECQLKLSRITIPLAIGTYKLGQIELGGFFHEDTQAKSYQDYLALDYIKNIVDIDKLNQVPTFDEHRLETLLSFTDNISNAFVKLLQEQKEKDEKNFLAKERYAKLINCSTDIIWETNQEGKITYINSNLETILGCTPEELIGTHVIYSDKYTVDEKRDIHNEVLRDALLNGKNVQDMEISCIAKDGSVKHFLTNVTPKYDKQHKVVGLIGIDKDITNIKEQQEKLLSYHKAIEATSDAIVLLDISGNISYVNSSFIDMFGFTAKEIKEQGIGAIYDKTTPTDLNKTQKKIKALEGWSDEITLYRKDGKLINIHLRADLIKDDKKNIIGHIVTHTNISQIKQKESEIIQSKKRLHKLFENMPQGFAEHELIYDKEGKAIDYKYLYTNPEFERIMGKFDYKSSTGTDVLRNEIQENWINHFAEVAESGKPAIRQVYSKKQNKHYRIVSYSYKKGQFATLIEDISESVNNNKLLSINEVRLSQAMEAGQLGAYKRKFKSDIIEGDNNLWDIIGLEPNTPNIMQSLIKNVHPKDLNLFLSQKKDLECNTIPNVNIDIRYLHPTRGERWINLRSIRLQDEGEADDVSVGIVQDITDRKNADLEVLFQKELSTILTNISTQYINTSISGMDKAIDDGLSEIGKFFKADRSFIFKYNLKENYCENKFEWCEEGVPSLRINFSRVSIDEIRSMTENHKQGKHARLGDIEKQNTEPSRNFMQKVDMKSLNTTPIFVRQKLWGFIGFDFIKEKRDFTAQEISLLNVFASIISNINDRIISEKEKQEQHEYLKTVIDTIPDYVFAKNKEGVYNMGNIGFSELCNISPSELIGKNDYDIFDKKTASYYKEHDLQALKSSITQTNEEVVIYPNGKRVTIEMRKTPIRDKNNKTLGIIGVGRNITLRKKQEADLTRSQRSLESLKQVSEYEITDLNSFFYFAQREAIKLTDSEESYFFLFNNKTQKIQNYSDNKVNVYSLSDTGLWGDVIRKKRKHTSNGRLDTDNIYKQFPTGISNVSKWLSIPIVSEGMVIGGIGVTNKDDFYTKTDIRQLSLMLDSIEKKMEAFKLQEEQQKTQKYISNLIDTIPIGIALIDYHSDEFILTNKALRQMLEINPETQNPVQLIEQLFTSNQIEEIIQELEINNTYRIENIPVCTNESHKELWTSITVNVNNFFGRDDIVLATFYDITENKKLELKIHQAYDQINKATSAADLGMWDWRPLTKELYSNDSFETMLGYESGHFPNTTKKWESIVHPDDIEWVTKSLHAYLKASPSERYDLEYRLIHKNGQQVWIRDVGDIVEKNEKGECVRFHGFHIDITAQKELQTSLEKAKEEAEAANLSKSTFLANMSHEIRTPMNAIIGFSEILGNRIHDAVNADYIKSIQSSGKVLLAIINDVLDFSKIEAGQFIIQQTPVCLREYIHEIATIFKLKAKNKEIEFNLILKGEIPEHIVIDELRLKQVLINLLGNAFKFTKEGMISLEIEAIKERNKDYSITFKVTDTGIGISKSQHKHIFNAFQQQEQQDNRKYGGTGLGLSISNSLVKLMGSKIHLESELSKGSTFSFTLKNLKAPQQEGKEKRRNKDSLTFKNASILIIDSNLTRRETITKQLNSSGLKTTVIDDLTQSHKSIKNKKPDIILCEYNETNKPLIEQFANRKTRLNIPFLGLTQIISEEMNENIEIISFSECINDPFDENKLLKKITKHLPYSSSLEHKETNIMAYNEYALKNNAILISILKNRFKEKFRKYKTVPSIKNTKELAENLLHIGQKENNIILQKIAEDLAISIDSFNVEKIDYIIDLLDKLLNEVI